jgi:hypothetical protein
MIYDKSTTFELLYQLLDKVPDILIMILGPIRAGFRHRRCFDDKYNWKSLFCYSEFDEKDNIIERDHICTDIKTWTSNLRNNMFGTYIQAAISLFIKKYDQNNI